VGMRLLVTGGTGTFGSHALPVLLARGHDIRVLSRRERPQLPTGVIAVRGDLASNAGVEVAVADVDMVVHAASDVRRMGRSDETQTRHLLAAAESAGVRRVLYLSIVGIDQVTFGYYRKKLVCEALVAASSVPHTTLRSTQFHDLLGAVLHRTERWPFLPVPLDWRFQPIAPQDVAGHALDLLETDDPPERDQIGGPEVHTLRGLIDTWRSIRGGPRAVALPLPGRLPRLIREGKLTVPERSLARQTWGEYVDALPQRS
jgi:uncharacterized protein YbjT (DUF2867 family)